MSGNPGDFESTLEELAAARDAVEIELMSRLEGLAARTRAATAAAREAESLAAQGLPEAAPVATDAPEPGEVAAAPPRRLGLPGMRGRLAHWLLGEHLEQQRAGHQALASDVAAGQERLGAAIRAIAERMEQREQVARDEQLAQYRRTEAVREALNRVIEAVDEIAGLVRQTRDLMNAKDAEAVHRATHGVTRRTDLLLDEIGRQQEALLAQLVGKRAELEELVRRASAPSD